jgi:uncharacterized protein (TIRG00374 family)
LGKKLKSALQVLFSLAIGFFLIWIFYKDLTEEDKQSIMESFANANYWWILIATLIGVLSHVFRAYRWKYTLEPLNIQINFINRFAAVMIGYIANLAFPRLGEVSRCAVLGRYQKQPFEKLFGTVVAERVVDAVILLLILTVTLLLQLNILGGMAADWLNPFLEKVQNQLIFALVGVAALVVAFLGWRFMQNSQHRIALAIRSKLLGLWEGIISLKTMKGQFGFYLHTALIWLCYIGMNYFAFFAFPETHDIPFAGIMASFVMGGLTIVAVQGGLGAYPLGVMTVLLLYGVDRELGYAFGWIVWCAQTVMIITLGFISLLIMPLINAAPILNEGDE